RFGWEERREVSHGGPGDFLKRRAAVHRLEEPKIGAALFRQFGNEVCGMRAEKAQRELRAMKRRLAEMQCAAAWFGGDGGLPLPDIVCANEIGAQANVNRSALLERY